MLFNHKKGREVRRKGLGGGENQVERGRKGKWKRRKGERKDKMQAQELSKITLTLCTTLKKTAAAKGFYVSRQKCQIVAVLTITLHFRNSIHSSQNSREKTNHLPPQLPLYLQKAFKSSKQMASYMKIFKNKKHFHFISGL